MGLNHPRPLIEKMRIAEFNAESYLPVVAQGAELPAEAIPGQWTQRVQQPGVPPEGTADGIPSGN